MVLRNLTGNQTEMQQVWKENFYVCFLSVWRKPDRKTDSTNASARCEYSHRGKKQRFDWNYIWFNWYLKTCFQKCTQTKPVMVVLTYMLSGTVYYLEWSCKNAIRKYFDFWTRFGVFDMSHTHNHNECINCNFCD